MKKYTRTQEFIYYTAIGMMALGFFTTLALVYKLASIVFGFTA